MKKEIYILIGLIAIFSLALVLPAKAAEGDLGDASTTPANPYINNVSPYSVSFKTHEVLPKQFEIRLIFPAGFDVAGATATTTMVVTYAGSPIVATSTVSGQEITLFVDDGTDPVSSTSTVQVLGIPGILNPSTAGSSYTLGVITRSSLVASGTVDSASTTAFTIFNVGERRPAADTTPPTSKITSPTEGLTISAGKKYVINGIGTDVGGSTVNRVEISLDDGKNWFSAQSNTSGNSYSWEYVWENSTEGEYTIKARATDEVGNIESPSAGVKVTVSVAVPPSTPSSTLAPEKPITEMTVQELEAKITEIQQKVIVLLQQLIQLIQQQIQELLAK